MGDGRKIFSILFKYVLIRRVLHDRMNANLSPLASQKILTSNDSSSVIIFQQRGRNSTRLGSVQHKVDAEHMSALRSGRRAITA